MNCIFRLLGSPSAKIEITPSFSVYSGHGQYLQFLGLLVSAVSCPTVTAMGWPKED